MKLTDPVIIGCLDKLRRGDIFAVGVLADYLEENGLPWASTVRKMWQRYCRREAYFSRKDFSRSKRWTQWEAIAAERRTLTRKIAMIYERKWVSRPLTFWK